MTQTQKKYLQIAKGLGLITLVALTGCSNGKDKSHNSGPQWRTVIMGNPLKIIDGATLSPDIDLKMLADFKTATFLTGVSFANKETFVETKETVEEQNAPSKGDEAPEEIKPCQIKALNENELALSCLDSLGVDLILTNQKMQSGDLHGNVAKFSKDGKNFDNIQLIHSSFSADHNMFSLLFYYDIDGEQALAGFYFAKEIPPAKPEQISTDYFYMNGPGVKIGWPRDQVLHLQTCGSEAVKDLTAASVNKWNEALAGRLKIEWSVAETFAPFSDLNQKCIYMVDEYMFDGDPSQFTMGFTLTVTDWQSLQFADSDIVISVNSFERMHKGYLEAGAPIDALDEYIQLQREITVVHEMGHLLGLHHQFTGVPSIMSYKSELPVLTEYDHAAIQALYEGEEE